ncbi:hypothetical protein ACMAY7_05845 [Rhodobacteraceae bacterium nBUS_24]|jgi:hypothetical protein|nr:hypothetical protein [Marinovum sp.]MDG1425005.1 hypothetical protein [Paracoccaceae bacterium]MBT4871193.1 hypothetical protein [Marinovum sp.]MBT6099619.1 hypothetical protein [Marinovum sp.]MBT6508500.1 hypothetical protein [Marinovum sp.]
MKQGIVAIVIIAGFAAGFYFAMPYIKTNTKPKNWETGYETPVSPRLKNTLNGLGKGF